MNGVGGASARAKAMGRRCEGRDEVPSSYSSWPSRSMSSRRVICLWGVRDSERQHSLL